MKIIPLAVAFVLLASLLAGVAVGADEKLKIKNADGSEKVKDTTQKKKISLEDAAAQNEKLENEGVISKGSSKDEEPESVGYESVDDVDYIRNEVSAGNKLFVIGMINALYDDLKSNPVNEDGDQGGVLFSVVTFVPNPYEDKTIVELYGGYLNLTLYAIVLFVLGELISRSIARTKLTDGTLRHKDLSGHRFIGGIAMCGFALIANVFYMLALDIIEALNEFITIPVIPNLAINPDNVILLGVSGLCDLLLVGFFGVRYFIIYVVAVVCSVIAFLLVPESTREFATDCIEKIIRLLLLQPAALFVTAIGLTAIDKAPFYAQSGGVVWLTLLVFLTCWYFMFGNYKILKTAVVFVVRKGVTKI